MSGAARREVLAFPGQGVDPVATVALLDAHRDDPLVRHLPGLTGRDRWTAQDMTDTTVAQPCIVAAGLLAARAVPVDQLVAVAGHSLGEITALAFAGAMTAEAALDLVGTRARLGAAAQARRGGAMVALLKLDADAVEWIRRSASGRTGGVLDLAVDNGPKQVVLSGDEDAVRAAAAMAEAEGGVARVLGIGGSYHTSLLIDAVASFTEAARLAATVDPRLPVITSTGGGVITTAGAVPDVLGRALVRPVRWVRTMQVMVELGADGFVDAGPGRTLANLADKTPVLAARALSDP